MLKSLILTVILALSLTVIGQRSLAAYGGAGADAPADATGTTTGVTTAPGNPSGADCVCDVTTAGTIANDPNNNITPGGTRGIDPVTGKATR